MPSAEHHLSEFIHEFDKEVQSQQLFQQRPQCQEQHPC